MSRYELNVEDRKIVVKRLVELTGEVSHYTKMPRCAFEIGFFTIEKDNTLVVEDEKGKSVIETLAQEGLIRMGDDAEQGSDETEKASEETADDSASGDDGDLGLEAINIQLPMEQHTATSIRNLIFMIYSRGGLLSKATGGEFRVEEGLVEALKDDTVCTSIETIMRAVADYEDEHGKSIYGVTFMPDRLSFTGFPAPKDPDHVKAFTQLSALMNQMAISQKRIQAKAVDDSNERYSLRIWLIRLGMAGDEYKRTRNLLMQPLSGNTAFKTEEDADRFKTKMKAKRNAEKAGQTADDGEEDA